MRIIKTNRQDIYELTSEQREKIKNSLTFENPAYKQAKRYGRSKYISIPPYLTYYNEFSVRSEDGERKKMLSVPLGTNVKKILDVPFVPFEDKRNEVQVKFPKFLLELRNDQIRAEKEYMKEVTYAVQPKNIIQLPTGKGKSILALHIAQKLKQKTLVLVHKDDLVVGWTKDIKLCFGNDIDIGLIKAKSRKVGKQITIATVQTLSRMSEEELNKYTSEFGLVVQDECLVGNTLVCLEDGGVKKIQNIRNDESVLGGSVSNKFRRESEVYELQANHTILKGSPTHPTWCVKKGKKHYELSDLEYKPIKDITNEYYIPIQVQIPHTQKNNLSVEEARFVAMIMCDGHLDSTSKRVKVNVQKDRKFYYDIMKDFADVCGAELKYSHDTRENITYWFTNDTVKSILTSKWEVPTGKKSNVITIPEFLYYAPLDTIKAFIETCFNCEGDLSISEHNSVRTNFNTVSEDFAQGLCLLLKKFGIVANIQHIRRSGKHNDAYRLTIGGVFYNKFAETFTLMDRKQTPIRNTKTQGKRFVGEFYLSPVKRVSDLGYKDYVYDFTVNSMEHSFVANGAYTHNCHHTGLNIFNIIDKFNSKYRLGLSATPKRSDGLNFVFDLFFGGLCYKHIVTEDDEDICGCEVRVLDSNFKYKPFIHDKQVFNYYDFDPKDLPDKIQFLEDMEYKDRPNVPYLTIDNEAVRSPKTKIMVCKKIIEHYKQGHSIIALFTQKEHIDLYYRHLCRYVPKEQIILYYGDSKEKSEDMMKKAEDREVLITLATYAKATEGTNVKSWEVEFLVSSINNEKNVEQATGRVRRRKEGKLNPVLVYDVRYSSSYSLKSHFSTRVKVYRKLKYKVVDSNNKVMKRAGMFSRGYN